MAKSTSSNSETHQNNNSNQDNMLDVNEDLEKMTEHVENQSVQLTWMAYDMVVLRTNPALSDAMLRLEQAYVNCRAAVCGTGDDGQDLDPQQHLSD